jgi:hypothetical protein
MKPDFTLRAYLMIKNHEYCAMKNKKSRGSFPYGILHTAMIITRPVRAPAELRAFFIAGIL